MEVKINNGVATIPVADPAKSRAFYSSLFGPRRRVWARVAWRDKGDLWRIEDVSRLRFVRAPANPRRAVELSLEVPNSSAAWRAALSRGGRGMTPPGMAPWGRRGFSALDPDRFVVEATEPERPALARRRAS